MKPIQKYAVAAAMALSISAVPASASILIDFEDVTPFTTLPTSYHGFTWSGGQGANSWVIFPEFANTFPGTEAHSQTNYAWSNGGTDLSISDGTFTMSSLWARIGSASTGTAIAHGFLGSTELFTQTLNLTDSHQLFNLNFTGIDHWTLTDQTTNVLIDDITLNGDGAAAVPEPSQLLVWSILATCGGAAGVSLRRRS